MAAELGDVLWYLARAAAELDYHLSTIAEMNVEKLKSRKERNVISSWAFATTACVAIFIYSLTRSSLLSMANTS